MPDGMSEAIAGILGAAALALAAWAKQRLQEKRDERRIRDETGIHVPRRGSDSGMVPVVSQLIQTIREEGAQNRTALASITDKSEKAFREVSDGMRAIAEGIRDNANSVDVFREHYDETRSTERESLNEAKKGIADILKEIYRGFGRGPGHQLHSPRA
jgi:hypothetical protein